MADDQQLIREGIASLLGIQPGIDVVGTARNGREAVEQAVALAADVVLMDVRMPGCDGTEATARIRRELPACRVVMLTTFDDEEYVVQALRPAPPVTSSRTCPPPSWPAPSGWPTPASPSSAPRPPGGWPSALARHPAPAPGDASGAIPAQPGQPLTARETDVLRLVARGATNREIAARLFLSEGTVKNHLSRILARLGLRDRTHAAIYARDHGLL